MPQTIFIRNVMIRVNCVRFNTTAADAQVAQLGIGGLWAWYDLRLNVWSEWVWAPTGLGVEMSLSALTYFWQLFTNHIVQCGHMSVNFY